MSKLAFARPDEGKRARNRRETQAKIHECAIRLFVAHGFDAVTADDIAREAQVSRRTFFYHFPTKEDAAFGWLERLEEKMTAHLLARPRADPPGKALMAAVAMVIRHAPRGAERVLVLVQQTPSLSRTFYARHAQLEQALTDALLLRVGDSNPLRCRLMAMAIVGLMRLSTERWLEGGMQESPLAFFMQASRTLQQAVRGFAMPDDVANANGDFGWQSEYGGPPIA